MGERFGSARSCLDCGVVDRVQQEHHPRVRVRDAAPFEPLAPNGRENARIRSSVLGGWQQRVRTAPARPGDSPNAAEFALADADRRPDHATCPHRSHQNRTTISRPAPAAVPTIEVAQSCRCPPPSGRQSGGGAVRYMFEEPQRLRPLDDSAHNRERVQCWKELVLVRDADRPPAPRRGRSGYRAGRPLPLCRGRGREG